MRNGGKNTLVLSTILLTEIGAAVYKVIYMAIGECGVEVLQKKIFHAKRCVKWNVWQRIFRS